MDLLHLLFTMARALLHLLFMMARSRARTRALLLMLFTRVGIYFTCYLLGLGFTPPVVDYGLDSTPPFVH